VRLNAYKIGAYEVIRIPETSCPAVVSKDFYPALDRALLAADTEWAAPDFYEPSTDKVVLSTHTWLITTPRFNVLFELAAGNEKIRPNFPRAHQLHTQWLENFRSTGLEVEDVDFLFPSHLHVDHVGWFTTLRDGAWEPLFPRAKALVAQREMDNWTPGIRTLPFPKWNEGVIEDCVLPVRDAGLLELVPYGHEIDTGLTIEAMPGHTFGHAGLRLESEGEGALLCGDTLYSPIQLVHPDLNAYADEDPVANKATRERVLSECADKGYLLFPSHFPEPFSAVEVSRGGQGFNFRRPLQNDNRRAAAGSS
jgi:glyoxylase-like metal-dependent hydrolase (beta-lactamase superfamily II)